MSIGIFRSTNGQFYFRIVASNGQTLASSETYHNKQDAINAAYLIKNQAGSATVYDYT